MAKTGIKKRLKKHPPHPNPYGSNPLLLRIITGNKFGLNTYLAKYTFYIQNAAFPSTQMVYSRLDKHKIQHSH
jgi:hypothetical protein